MIGFAKLKKLPAVRRTQFIIKAQISTNVKNIISVYNFYFLKPFFSFLFLLNFGKAAGTDETDDVLMISSEICRPVGMERISGLVSISSIYPAVQ